MKTFYIYELDVSDNAVSRTNAKPIEVEAKSHDAAAKLFYKRMYKTIKALRSIEVQDDNDVSCYYGREAKVMNEWVLDGTKWVIDRTILL